LKPGDEISKDWYQEVEAGRKPRTGLKHDVGDGVGVGVGVSRQGENPERD